jgi:hypothetical protein
MVEQRRQTIAAGQRFEPTSADRLPLLCKAVIAALTPRPYTAGERPCWIYSGRTRSVCVSWFERVVPRRLRAALTAHGFARRGRVFLRSSIVPGLGAGWLGLNEATSDLPDRYLINPVVAVHHPTLASALAELVGWSRWGGLPHRPLGYLTPQSAFVEWEFRLDGDLHAVADDLADAVDRWGQPFIEHWADWHTLSTDLATSELLLAVERPFVLSVIAAMNGNLDQATRIVHDELDSIGEAQDVYATAVRTFAARFATKYGQP